MKIDGKAQMLPAYAIAGRLNSDLQEGRPVVVTAPPGAGKSTLLPLTILKGLGSKGKIVMLEPRRIAARQIAERMADILGEPVGRTVGYRVRFESKVSTATRIEVITEGILTRMLIDDPTLEGVDVVIFDEFHERSLNSDVALALTRESQQLVRPELKLVIMSATIDAAAICSVLGAKLLECEGRMFPIQTVNSRNDAEPASVVETTVQAIRLAHREHEGDILAFLPGEAEIRRCQEMLEGGLGKTGIFPLYGMLPPEEQHRAITPSLPGERKVVLATPVAETSLTIEGVRIVVDSGFCRKMLFDPQSGLSRIETVRISRDMADQRRGRAGRVAPGVCYRLWSMATDMRLQENRTAEILDADLSGMVLDIAAWGNADASTLPWLTPPPASHLQQASKLLLSLGAIDEKGNITRHGKRLASLPCHPRIANMLSSADSPCSKALAADIAALLEEKDPLPQEGADICLRVEALRRSRSGRLSRMARIAQQYRAMVHTDEDNSHVDAYQVGRLIAAAYPERVAKARTDSSGQYILASGENAFLDAGDDLSAYDWIAVASMNPHAGSAGRIFLAAPVDPHELGGISRERDVISWDSRKGAAVAQHELRIGGLLVDARAISGVREEIVKAICEAAPKEGLSMFDFSDEVQNLQRRIAAVSSWRPELELPDCSTEAVLARASEWLPLYIGNASSCAELKKIDMRQVIWGLLGYELQNSVERLAPSHIEVPTGSRIRLEYRQGAEAPVLRVRLQECFGLTDTPKVDDGRRVVLMELLSPGYKPVQLTSDLRSFWNSTYFEVRKELKRRYPKHSWPDTPLTAEAVRGVKKV